jgi:F0F1-type ATP synthase assembly protein I
MSPYMAAIKIFVRISVWVAIPIILALFIGKWIDAKYSTAPWGFLGTMGLAFIISMVAIAKICIQYIREIEDEAKLKKQKENGTNITE